VKINYTYFIHYLKGNVTQVYLSLVSLKWVPLGQIIDVDE